jgi:NIMA (never in mitosis gene a)-related kinase
MSSLSDKEKENALNEVRILASIKNKFVVSYKDAFIDDTSQSL